MEKHQVRKWGNHITFCIKDISWEIYCRKNIFSLFENKDQVQMKNQAKNLTFNVYFHEKDHLIIVYTSEMV